MRRLLICFLIGWVSLAASRAARGHSVKFRIYDPGSEDIISYEKYGCFLNVGTPTYQYVITNWNGLVKASGEGIDPSRSITNNPEYMTAMASGKIPKGRQWKHVNSADAELDYFVWNNAEEDPGVRLLQVGRAMERGGQLRHALKAYRAVLVLYPDSAAWGAGDKFQWSAANAALKNIKNLLKDHPELGLRLVDAEVNVGGNRFDPKITVNPGRLEMVVRAPVETQTETGYTNGIGRAVAFELLDSGTEDIIDYQKYGLFKNVGNPNYEYVMTNREGLCMASGEGIDPSQSITNRADYRKVRESEKLGLGDHWKHVNTSDPKMDYFVWNDAMEDPGIRLLFVGKAMEKAGHLMHALKAYRAVMVLYPDSATWSAGGEFQWSAAEAAWNSIQNLLRDHPELGLKLVGADVTVRADMAGLKVALTPGRFERRVSAPDDIESSMAAVMLEDEALWRRETFDTTVILQQRGEGTVQLVQYGNSEWQMIVDDEPYFIHGMNFAPVKVGVLPWEWNWLWADENTNGIVDSFEVWVDANGNGVRDEDEPITSDYQLMKDMGVNTIKLYITDEELQDFNYLAMRRIYKEYGIRAIIGNFFGAYCHGSGASWDAGTDYTIRKQRENMMASVSNLVMKLKDEPWLLAWVLGNENNMEMSGDVNATRTNASKYPETYAKFLNEVCRMIHELDPNHPVGVGNLLVGLVEYYGMYSPELDYVGINSYIGEDGFGATWQKVKQKVNRPVCIMEYGCDAYWTKRGPDEETQSRYIVKNWKDIVYNSAGFPGAGNSIGGFLFEWLDEWWKDTLNYFEDPIDKQTTRGVFPMPFPDGFAQEEWFGIMSQGEGQNSPFLRVPRKAYTDLKKIWNITDEEGGAEE